MNDNTQLIADSILQLTSGAHSFNWWMLIAILEFALILFLLLFKRAKTDDQKKNIKRKVMAEGDINNDNLINSMFNAEALYKALIRACHPDRFAPDEEKVAIANDITERLGNHRHDMSKLNELKKEAIEKLNINI
ncbi:MAG: hypothetical protein K6A28_03270 [Bacteroidales bacterium]|nr:hypothetical protein [Bacteroidales bacterium]